MGRHRAVTSGDRSVCLTTSSLGRRALIGGVGEFCGINSPPVADVK